MLDIAKLPLRFYESHRITIPEGGTFYVDGKPAMEDTVDAVMKTMRAPQVTARAKATSSGVLINGRVYPGEKMKASTHFLTDQHGKPILSRHPINKQDQPDRVGRVTAAEYIQTFTDKAWMHDYRSPKRNGHAGSGHIMLDSLIGGQENVERVLDKRDLTLSVGFTPTQFFCSICMHDWVADDGPCGHEPGKIYEVDGKKPGIFLCFGITGLLIYDHVANVNFPADPTAQFLSTTFQDAAKDLDYLTSRTVDSYQSQLAGFILTDTADNRVLELQLDPPPVVAQEAPQRQDEAQLSVAVELDLSRDPHKENPMADTTKTDPAPKTATDDKPPVDPKTDATPPVAKVTDDKPAGEGQDNASAWTQPDPIDGHTHGVAELDGQGGGRTTMSIDGAMPAHDHPIKFGRVRSMSGGEGDKKYVSRHPDSFFFDEDGKTKAKMLDESTDVDGKPVLTDDKDADKAKVLDNGCVDDCQFDFSAQGLEKEFVLTDALEDAVETTELPEMQDMIETQDFHAAGKLTDAPLTSAQRKKIPSNLFCGPNRTFPAHDKARVRNGLSRLPQAKNFTSSQKASILSCLKKRAKTLGVEVSGTDSLPAGGTLMDGPDQAILKTLGKDIETKTVEIGQLRSSVDEKTKELDATSTQLQDAETENLRLLTDSIINMKLALRKPDMSDVKTTEDMQKVRDELAQRSVDSLKDFARELQVELAAGGGAGALVSPAVAPPKSEVGSLGGAPTSKAGEDNKTLADETLERFKGLG